MCLSKTHTMIDEENKENAYVYYYTRIFNLHINRAAVFDVFNNNYKNNNGV